MNNKTLMDLGGLPMVLFKRAFGMVFYKGVMLSLRSFIIEAPGRTSLAFVGDA